MKKLFTLVGLLGAVMMSAQETADNAGEGFRIDWNFRAYGIYPIQLGDHSLAKAHDANIGYGLNMGFVSYDNFSLYGGLEFVKYDVTDRARIGNIENSNYTSVYGAVKYKIAVADNIALYPAIGLGSTVIKQRTRNKFFGEQDGTELRLGLSANYSVSERWSLFLGTHFIYSRLQINTSPEYEKFFGQANQLQLSVGIQFE